MEDTAKVSYCQTEDDTYRTHSFSVTIPSILQQEATEFRTDAMNDLRPQLNMRIWDHERGLDLSCLFPTCVFMRGTISVKTTKIKEFSMSFIKANKWRHLVDMKHKKEFLSSNDSLVFEIHLKVFKNFNGFLEEPESEHLLSDGLKDSFEKGLYTDAVIESKDGKQHRVHKIVLAATSPVLKAILVDGTQDLSDSRCPFDSEVLEQVLSYMYTDKVTRLEDLARELLAASDYYQLNGLKIMCEEQLCRGLGAHNLQEMLQLAQLHRAADLEQAVMEYGSLPWKARRCLCNPSEN